MYLHGGPGSGCQPDHRRLFDPERFHAVLFDQRGCGRSTPKRSREANTLPHLIADLEAIRTKFGFERWMVAGGSWGATLALAYAEKHPQRVSGLVLRATFLGTYEEIESGFCERLPRFYPGLSEDFLSLLPKANAPGRSTPIGGAFSIPIRPCMARRARLARHRTHTLRACADADAARACGADVEQRPARDALHGSALLRQ